MKFATLLLLACALPVAAQEISTRPSPVSSCLMPAPGERGLPAYPYTPYKQGLAGRVRVELIFTTPDGRPEVRVLESEGSPEFVDAVRTHVGRLRTPCLEFADIPARLVQDYVFSPDEGQVAARSIDDAEARQRRAQHMACLTHAKAPAAVVYPPDALRAGVQGRLLVEMTFTGPDTPPQIQTHTTKQARTLIRPVESWALGSRLPCHDGAAASRLRTLFIFRFEGDAAYGFNPIDFRSYVAGIRDLKKQRVNLDTHTMGCPFDVRVSYYKPFANNEVAVIGEFNPAREPLLAWLESSELDLSARQLEAVFGDKVTFTVPCIRINLEPKE